MFSELFEKEDYSISKVVATSFTYNNRLLGDILIKMYMVDCNLSLKDSSLLNKLELLENAHEKYKDKLKICIHKQTEPSANYSDKQTKNADRYLYKIRKEYVKEIEMEGGYFHPKMILVQFTKKEKPEEVCYRIMISSKNLVYDKFHQLGCVFEGTITNKEQSSSTGGEIQKLLEKVRYKGMNLSEVEFKGDSLMKDLSFHVGIPKDTVMKGALVADLKNEYNEHIFITDTINLDFPKAIGVCLENKPILVANNKSIRGACKTGPNTYKFPKPLNCHLYSVINGYNHAKTYLFHKDNKLSVWTGSANCTQNAYTNNYELMAHYTLECDKKGFDKIKRGIIDERGRVTQLPPETTDEKKDKLIESIQNIKIECRYEDKTLLVEFEEQCGALKEQKSYFTLPFTPKKYEIVDNKCKVPITSFNALCLDEKVGLLILRDVMKVPDKSGNATIYPTISLTIPVTLTICGAKDIIEAAIEAAKKKDCLYTGILPKLRDFIPATTKDGVQYDEKDTAETRLVKYRSNGGCYDPVKEVLEKFIADNDNSENEELDEDETAITELQSMLEDVREFISFLEI